MIPEDLMRKYKYGYVHSCEILNEAFVKDLIKENQELKQVLSKIKETLNDEVKFDYLQENVDIYGVKTVNRTTKSFVLKEKIEKILKEAKNDIK